MNDARKTAQESAKTIEYVLREKLCGDEFLHNFTWHEFREQMVKALIAAETRGMRRALGFMAEHIRTAADELEKDEK